MTRRESLFAFTAPIADSLMDPASSAGKLKVVCVGAHPDDPETGCGGTLARYSARGHNVTIIYLTRGEAGIKAKTHAEAARIRTEEALKACSILGAKAVFAGQIDGSSEISNDRYDSFGRLLRSENPDIVLAHWPVDTHRDHCAASLLAYHSWRESGKKFALAYFEVLTGEQTQEFNPDFYVDITETWEKKKEACYAHSSQGPSDFYPYHEQMERFRGLEHGCKRAEAFIAHAQGPPLRLAW